jgi:hypothetical protein
MCRNIKTLYNLLGSLVTMAPPRDRETEAAKARARNEVRFGVR